MSENTNNKNEDTLADFYNGEDVIPAEKVEEYKEAIKEALETKKIAGPEDVEISENQKPSEYVISAPTPGSNSKPSLGYVANGALGSTTVPKAETKKPAKAVTKEAEKVAIHSTKNVTWSEVGKVYRGYNIVTKDQADKWLTRNHTRLATPEEVAKEFKN